MEQFETVIVGAGPIGIETAVELGRRGISATVFDGGAIGQQVVDFPPRTRWFSSPERLGIAGVPFITPSHEKGTREEYLAYLRAVVDQFSVDVRTFERIESLRRIDDSGFQFSTKTLSGLEREYQCKTVVLATGGTARPRRLGIPGEEMPHVHRTIGEPHRFHGRKLLIVGGRNSAAEAAVVAFRCGAQVTLSYRGPQLYERVKYWIRPELEAMIESGQVVAAFNTTPKRIEADSVVLASCDSGVEQTLPIDDVLMAIGFESDMSLFESLGVALEGDDCRVVHDEATMCTSVPGVYVAGTAVAGTQHRFRVYIENAHIHALRIAAALAGEQPPPPPVFPKLPES